jgi:small subunit ribosomal protein S4e
MSHLKRQAVPKKWPIERKGSVYVVKTSFGTNQGVPVLIALRDMLKLTHDRKEAKQAIHMRQILLNEKPVIDEKSNIQLFDTLSILPMKKYYRLELSETGKFHFNEIKESDANKKIAKITNKKMLKGKKLQLNLSDGRNFISNVKCNINDSAVINLKEGKIEKCVPFKENSKIIVFAGKHLGDKGEITSINLEEKTAQINSDGKEKNILIKQLMVTE